MMMKRTRTHGIVAVLTLAIVGCSDDNGPTAPENGTPGEQASYEGDIQPIWDQSCGSSCHGESGLGGLDLRPGESHANLVNVISPTYSVARVVPADPEGSVLYNKIVDTGTYGGLMPPGGPALSSADIELIRAWILAGAPNGVFDLPSD